MAVDPTVPASILPLWVHQWIPLVELLLVILLVPFLITSGMLLRQRYKDQKEHSSMLREWVADERTRRQSEKEKFEEQIIDSQTQLTSKFSEIQTWQDKYDTLSSHYTVSLEAVQAGENLINSMREHESLLKELSELRKKRIERLEKELSGHKQIEVPTGALALVGYKPKLLKQDKDNVES